MRLWHTRSMTINPTHSLDECYSEALSLLLDYKRAEPDARTRVLRQLAEVIVEARGHFLNADGEPDWKGLTHAYRRWIHDLYSSAHFTRDETTSVQAAVRYHLGAVLRSRLDNETLVRLGIMQESPKERSKQRRTNRMALLNALTHKTMPRGDLLALSAVYSMLQNVTGDDFASLNDRDREVVALTLAEVERRVRYLQGRVRTPE